ncbi:extracellular matrix protein 1 [Megalops cyprinoides]|uniref:extracellular matrix protein 1 n=1 Tax=Megalops cyprinoides TaxID=118141 RepID=UPI001863B452|nr:extracellular matrix protein 1 [Megalops cyprinoides]XP_036372228.1 extracellular matrix protein 1 [Megalops cyprinoides]
MGAAGVSVLLLSCMLLEVFGPSSAEPQLCFPPARPSLSNIDAICVHGAGRRANHPHSLPTTGFSYLQRQADAINQMESLYSACCQSYSTRDRALTLSCAERAWEDVLRIYCVDEFSVKTSHYHCCRENWKTKWNCFNKEAPNPSYLPAV